MDPYKLLGVAYTATDAEIKKAYHALAKAYHPDNFADDPVKGELANRKMREINEAYERILADRERGIRGPSAYAAPPPPQNRPSAPTGRAEEPHYKYRESDYERPSRAERAEERRRRKEAERTAAEARYRPRSVWEEAGQEAPRTFVGYRRVREMINEESYMAALGELSRVAMAERSAEWHYLAGLAHLGCRHLHDALVEVEIACRTDKKNEEYRRARDEMRRTVAGSTARPEKKKRRGLLSSLWQGILAALGLDDDT